VLWTFLEEMATPDLRLRCRYRPCGERPDHGAAGTGRPGTRRYQSFTDVAAGPAPHGWGDWLRPPR
jgi:hypothetical protein